MAMVQSLNPLGFDARRSEAEQQNREHAFEKETAHLPSAMDEGVPFFRSLLEEHHAAILAADIAQNSRFGKKPRSSRFGSMEATRRSRRS